jgi:two-component system, NtrC family, nitrogen regulation sensor histidine kinase GlnL
VKDRDFAGLDLLASSVVVLNDRGFCSFINLAAEQLFELSPRAAKEQRFAQFFIDGSVIDQLLADAIAGAFSDKTLDIALERPGRLALDLATSAVTLESDAGGLLLDFRENDRRKRVEREVRLLDSANANRELLRNLAHEVKNPLGGIRGAAQLLEAEHPEISIREFTQIIIKEAGRLDQLVDRLLAPHRHARRMTSVNIHEVCERIRSVLGAEFGPSLVITRDYDASLPEFTGDREQLIQALLNIARNAAQAMKGKGSLRLMTRIARQVTITPHRHKLALDLHVIDNGPGIPEQIKERIFFPLVSGREGGTGLGLSLAQTFVQQHGGLIECESRPGLTDFRVLLPLN